MFVRCGNHESRTDHASVDEVRACYAEKYRYVTEEPRKVSGWWDLPIAASMWAADARDTER